MIKLENVVKSFAGRTILGGISLEINAGESIVIIGGSGSGKTVLTKHIAALMQPTSGKILWGNDEISSYNQADIFSKCMPRIGYLFQLNALFDSYKVLQNIMFSQLQNGQIEKDQALEIAKKKLADVSLGEHCLYMYPKELSGGMQKRVALARALAMDPDFLFFDEPTSGLDPLTSVKISHLLRDCSKSDGTKPIKISIMHDIKCAKIVGDKILYLKNGLVNWFGNISQIPSAMENHPDLREFIDSAE